MATPKNSIERLNDFSQALERLSLNDGSWPTDRNRRLKTEQLLRVALRTLQGPADASAPAAPELSDSDRAAAASAHSALQKLVASPDAKQVRPLLVSAIEAVKAIAGEAAIEATTAPVDTASKAAPRAAAPRTEAIKASSQNTRRPDRRGIV